MILINRLDTYRNKLVPLINERMNEYVKRVARLNMNMPVDLIQQVDEYTERMNLNRTSAMIVLVKYSTRTKSAMSVMDELLNKLGELEEKARAIATGGFLCTRAKARILLLT